MNAVQQQQVPQQIVAGEPVERARVVGGEVGDPGQRLAVHLGQHLDGFQRQLGGAAGGLLELGEHGVQAGQPRLDGRVAEPRDVRLLSHETRRTSASGSS